MQFTQWADVVTLYGILFKIYNKEQLKNCMANAINNPIQTDSLLQPI